MRLVQFKAMTLFWLKEAVQAAVGFAMSVQDSWHRCPEDLSLHSLPAVRGVSRWSCQIWGEKIPAAGPFITRGTWCAHHSHVSGRRLACMEGFPLLWFSNTGEPSLSLGVFGLTWAFAFLGGSQKGMDGHSKLAAHTVLLVSGSGTWTSVLSGSSAAFSVGVQSLQHLSRMSKRNVRCLTAVLNDTLLAECGTSASRCLNLQNGSLVLRRVEKDDEGQYEFVFHNTTRLFTLEVFGKLPS